MGSCNSTPTPSSPIPDEEDFEIEDGVIVGLLARARGAVVLPAGIKGIGEEIFEDQDLRSLTLPDTLTSIGHAAFRGCEYLTSLTIPDSVTRIDECAFMNCTSLTSLTLPRTLTSIKGSVFSSCTALTALTLPNTVTHVEHDAFGKCTSLTSLTLPDTVTKVGVWAFQNCSKLASLSLPYALTDFGKEAFKNCSALTSVVFRPSSLSREVFILWAVSSSRNHDNWEMTSMNRLRNVLQLVAAFAFEIRDINTIVDSSGNKTVFRGCTGLQ